MTTVFDADTALTRQGDTWHGEITDRWSVGAGPNGGYLATFPLRAMFDVTPVPQPRSMTTHYLQRPVPGPVTVQARVVHATRSHAYLAAEASQAHGAVLNAVAVFSLERQGEGGRTLARMPDFPPPETCTMLPPDATSPEIVNRFEYRPSGDTLESFWVDGPGTARIAAWVRFHDRDPDNLAVPQFADSFIPAWFGAAGPGLMPTLELTVHWRSRPHTPWTLALFQTRFETDGYIEEDGELWGEDGRLIAQSRQLARFVPIA